MVRLLTRRTVVVAGLAAAFVGGVGVAVLPAMAAPLEPPVPLAPLRAFSSGDAVAGRYIVVLKSKGATSAAVGRARRHGADVVRQYGTVVGGYAASLDAGQLEAVRRDGEVAYVEPDQVIHTAATQPGAPWGLDRVDQRNRSLDGAYAPLATGAGVTAYVIDTGIRTTHSEFGGRATGGFTSVNDGNGTQDCNGHGTHVAGTIGGATYGVAKSARLVAVRVMDCSGSGTTSGVIAGVEWVTANHASPAVANLSLGGDVSDALDAAVGNSIASGVTYAVAAGNETADACTSSPARLPAVITVGASTRYDARASYSDYGRCLDLFAPGSDITSAWNGSDTDTRAISGTSMASPHVAGVAALYLQTHPTAAPAAVASAITAGATANVLSGVGPESPNRLLYSGAVASTGGDPAPGDGPAPGDPPAPGGGSDSGNAAACPGATRLVIWSMSGDGLSRSVPGSGTYTTAESGTHVGCLTGPPGTNFDVYLQTWSDGRWATVASGDGGTSTERISYQGTSGSYRWVVTSVQGSGTFQLAIGRP